MSTNERETEMTETINERVARILNNAGWTCSGGAHEPGSYDICDDCRETCTDGAGVVIRAREEIKNAFRSAYAWGWYDACAEAEIKHRINLGPLNEQRAKWHSPYEQEEA